MIWYHVMFVHFVMLLDIGQHNQVSELAGEMHATSNRHLHLRNILRAFFPPLRGCAETTLQPRDSTPPNKFTAILTMSLQAACFMHATRLSDLSSVVYIGTNSGWKCRCVTWLGEIHVRRPTAGGRIQILARRVSPHPREIECPLTCG